MRRPIFALIVICAFLIAVTAQESKPQEPKPPQDKPAQEKSTQETKPAKDAKQSGDVKYTAEQIVESVILIYGTRPALEHIRRFGIERGKITRYNAEGNTEEANYERRFIRGENLDKDKIRLDQKLPTMEYSLIFGEGKLWGLINGAAFTPRQDATASFLSQHHHSIDTLLRYKECGATPTLVGKDQQKGLDLYVIDLVDKEKRQTRYYISQKSLRVLWLEYEEGSVKYVKKFLDYRPVQQTLAPYRTVLFEDGRQSQEVRVLTITYGIKVSDAIFKSPEA
ncbi:MAG TPA: hypothetical protein VFS76_05595 [Pyrinomonadaceae bacterium]|nr:hypothetical protein [Pyrinomonadaceae bacterium]